MGPQAGPIDEMEVKAVSSSTHVSPSPAGAPQSLPDWLSYLEQLHPATIDLGLERVQKVKALAGLNPGFTIITVGGTNGKGSTCAMLETILVAAGYKVGCYTSPHLIRYNERVRINTAEVTDEALVRSFAAIEAKRAGTSLTYFEFATLAAIELFMQEGIDVAVLEVGLGGRLDAVNAFDADCAIITSVDLDHMDYLGDTREKIGFEKAGIYRGGRPAIYAEPDMPATVAAHAEKIGARLYQFGRDFGYRAPDAQQWTFYGPDILRTALPLPGLRGGYQLQNASAALMALATLAERLPVTQNDIRQGLLEATVTGRFQVLPGQPQRIFDVAHNPHAARALASNLRAMPPAGRTIAVFAMLNDKDNAGVIAAMRDQVDLWLVAGIDAPRGASAGQLLAILQAQIPGVKAETFADAAAAYRHAYEIAAQNDRIMVFGSFYTVAAGLEQNARLNP